jgi:hypothetical protein
MIHQRDEHGEVAGLADAIGCPGPEPVGRRADEGQFRILVVGSSES